MTLGYVAHYTLESPGQVYFDVGQVRKSGGRTGGNWHARLTTTGLLRRHSNGCRHFTWQRDKIRIWTTGTKNRKPRQMALMM